MQFIAICDDEKNICANLEASLIDILRKLSIEHEIDVFATGAELYKKIKQGYQCDLLFLDIELAQDTVNGVEISRLIREAQGNNLISICFISWEMKYAMSLFDSQPLNFLIKPLDDDKIKKVVNQFTTLFNSRNATLKYKIGRDFYRRSLKEIQYLESQGRKIILHLIDGTTEQFYGKLRDVYTSKLQQYDFLFIHASYIVNYDHVIKFAYDEFTLTDGKRLPISQANRTKIRVEQHAIEKQRSKL